MGPKPSLPNDSVLDSPGEGLHPDMFVIPSPGPVGGRLALFPTVWQDKVPTDRTVVQWAQKGLRLVWDDQRPPTRSSPWPFPLPTDQDKLQLLEQEMSALVTKRAIEEVTNPKGFYSLVFLVPKKSGGWRPVFDLSQLNRFLVVPRFKMESALSIQRSLRVDKWAISIDIKDAYLHVPIHKASRRFLMLAFRDKVYQFRVLPFGVATAPYVFTRIIRSLAANFRSRGIHFHHYIDDWLIVADSPQQAVSHARYVLQFAIQLGWLPNWEKSNLVPLQRFEYVGVWYDLGRGLALPPRSRVEKIYLLIRRLLSLDVTSARQWLSLIGLLVSVEKQVPFGRCFLRPIQWCLALQWNIMTDSLEDTIVIDDRATEALCWWMDPVNMDRGMPLSDFLPDRSLFTDASELAWGAHMDEMELSGRWSPQERQYHINVLELKAVIRAYSQWAPRYPKGTRWLVYSDNTTVVAHINKQGGTRSHLLCLEAESLIRLALAHGHEIRARHLPGRRNVLADFLSRPDKILGTEWSLSPQVFQDICGVFGTPNIDLFATSKNTKLSVFCSPLPESGAYATDAMSLSWDGMFAYAYPPTGFLMEVLHKIARSDCTVLLVAPCWPTQPWFPLLLSLLVEDPRVLPCHRRLLKQPGRDIFHDSVGVLRLHVWKLSSALTVRQAFLRRCPVTSLAEIGRPPHGRTRPNGEYSYVGVTEDALIRSLPL